MPKRRARLLQTCDVCGRGRCKRVLKRACSACTCFLARVGSSSGVSHLLLAHGVVPMLHVCSRSVRRLCAPMRRYTPAEVQWLEALAAGAPSMTSTEDAAAGSRDTAAPSSSSRAGGGGMAARAAPAAGSSYMGLQGQRVSSYVCEQMLCVCWLIFGAMCMCVQS